MNRTPIANPTGEREVSITRIYDAPRELVWQAWVEPQRMAQWWGPRGFDNPLCEIDTTPGGKIVVHMRGPDGVVYPMVGHFDEVAAPERLVFTSVAEDADGNPLLEAHTEVTFEDVGGKTKLTVRAKGVGIAAVAAQMLAGMDAGWSQTLDKLGEFVASAK